MRRAPRTPRRLPPGLALFRLRCEMRGLARALAVARGGVDLRLPGLVLEGKATPGLTTPQVKALRAAVLEGEP